MKESRFQSEVIEAATKLGWLSYHTHDSRRSAPGFPDLTLVKKEWQRVIYSELKTDKGIATPEQLNWMDSLAMCGQEVYLWRPVHLEEIIEILTMGHKPTLAERLTMDSAVVYLPKVKEEKIDGKFVETGGMEGTRD